jgi:hypothetical protein
MVTLFLFNRHVELKLGQAFSEQRSGRIGVRAPHYVLQLDPERLRISLGAQFGVMRRHAQS